MARPKNNSTNNTPITEEETSLPDVEIIEEVSKELPELELLTEICADLSIETTPEDTVDTLNEKVKSKLDPVDTTEVKQVEIKSVTSQQKNSLRKQALLMKRVKIENLDPKERNLHGYYYCFLNSNTGKIMYYVPYGEHCGDAGVYLPTCILEILENKKYQNFREHKTPNGIKILKPYQAKKFIITYLPDITPKELAELKQRQKNKVT